MAVPPLSKRSDSTTLLPISKWAQDPVRRTAESILKIINFLLFRVAPRTRRVTYTDQRKNTKDSSGASEPEKVAATAAIGQSLSLVKNILSGLNPFFCSTRCRRTRQHDAHTDPERKRRPPLPRPMPPPPGA